jgi:hypothetical protein
LKNLDRSSPPSAELQGNAQPLSHLKEALSCKERGTEIYFYWRGELEAGRRNLTSKANQNRVI